MKKNEFNFVLLDMHPTIITPSSEKDCMKKYWLDTSKNESSWKSSGSSSAKYPSSGKFGFEFGFAAPLQST